MVDEGDRCLRRQIALSEERLGCRGDDAPPPRDGPAGLPPWHRQRPIKHARDTFAMRDARLLAIGKTNETHGRTTAQGASDYRAFSLSARQQSVSDGENGCQSRSDGSPGTPPALHVNHDENSPWIIEAAF
jgi:hypothetical protein